MKALALATLLSLSNLLPVFAQNQANPKPIMRSGVFQFPDFKTQTPNSTNNASYQNLFSSPTATLQALDCHVTILNPGKAPHPPHKHPDEELIILKEGSLEVMQNGVTNIVTAGGMIFCASNEIHGWRNPTGKPATYYVLKIVPHDLPKDKTNPAAAPSK